MPSISTGLMSWDYEVMGCGGIPRGRILEFIGPESSGKTTALLHVIAEEQRSGNLAALIDAEHALDPNYASQLGVNVKDLIVSQPDSGAVSIIGVDSVAALVPQAELDGEMGDSHMGLQARLMSQACRKLRGIVRQYDVSLVFTNQIRDKIGVMYGSPETTPGGRALRFYASARMDIRRREEIKNDDGEVIGHNMEIKAVKNKCGPPKRSATLRLIYGVGFDKEADLIQYGNSLGVVDRNGAWYLFRSERIGQGMEKAVAFLRTKPEMMTAIRVAVLEARNAQTTET